MRLRLTAPARVIVDREVTYVQAEDATGRFGILPGHEPFLTALVPSILVLRYREDGREREAFAAVRSGVLRVAGDVQVAVRDAQLSDDLEGLQRELAAARRTRAAHGYRSSRSVYQMQLSAWRRLLEFEDVTAR